MLKNIQTERLVLRELTIADAPFILELLNEPDWLRFIGDKGVKTLAEATNYIQSGPQQMYAACGMGLLLTELKADATPVGICGLIKRDNLPDVDIGFAFLSRFGGAGYAVEAAQALVLHAKQNLHLNRVVATTLAKNLKSIKLLERIGLKFEQMLQLEKNAPELMLFARSI